MSLGKIGVMGPNSSLPVLLHFSSAAFYSGSFITVWTRYALFVLHFAVALPAAYYKSEKICAVLPVILLLKMIILVQEFGDHSNIIKLLNVIRAQNDKDIYLIFEYMGMY